MAKRITKKDIYKEFGIEYDTTTEKILSPIGWINPLMVDGNEKIGHGVFHFSMLPGKKEFNVTVNGQEMKMFGTCSDDCPGCYGFTGNYAMYKDPYNNLAVRTIIAREHIDFFKAAIMAQIKADKVKAVRIHATGDFFSKEYLNAWIEIVAKNPEIVFWSYTKEYGAENAFNEFKNANIVKSNVLDKGYNYGTAEYVIALYNMLRDLGKDAYICRCGIDKNQHCTNCKACALCEHVLFLEHGTKYNPKKDPAFPAFKALVDSQGNKYLT